MSRSSSRSIGGVKKGFEEDVAQARANDVLAVLEARNVAVSAEQRERILACTDLDRLDRWLRTAATATHADELFAD